MIASIILALIMLVPSSVLLATPAQATSDNDNEIPTLLVVDGWTHEVPLKAIRASDGGIETQDDFEIEADDIITVQQNADLVIVPSEGKVDSVKVTDTQKKTTELAFSKLVTKQGLAPKSYLLDVVVLMPNGDKYAYETILTVLAPGQVFNEDNSEDIIQSFIVITIDIEIIFSESPSGNDTEPEELDICYFDTHAEECAPVNGECREGYNMNDDGLCFKSGPCPAEYARVDDDETGECYANTIRCEGSNAIVLRQEDCELYADRIPIEQLDNSTDSDSTNSNDSGDNSTTADEPKNDICLTSFGPPPNCSEVPEEFADPNADQLAEEEEEEEEEDTQNVEVEEEPEESEEEQESEESEAEGETNSEGGSEFD